MGKIYRTGAGAIGRNLHPSEVDGNFRDSEAREQYVIEQLAYKIDSDLIGVANGIASLNPAGKVNQTALDSDRLGGSTLADIHGYVDDSVADAIAFGKTITLNQGGAAGSGDDCGFGVEEAGVVTGYIYTNTARTGFKFKAPANTHDSEFVFTASAVRTFTYPDLSGTVALLNAGQTFTNATWNGSAIGDTYIASAATWNAKIGGSGTTGFFPKFATSSTLGNSIMSESGSTVFLNGKMTISDAATFTTGRINIIHSDSTVSMYLGSSSSGTGTGGAINFVSNSTAIGYIRAFSNASGATEYYFNVQNPSNSFPLRLAGADRMYVALNAGTLTSNDELQVNGSVFASGGLSVGYAPTSGTGLITAITNSGEGTMYLGTTDGSYGGTLNFYSGGGVVTNTIRGYYTGGVSYMYFTNIASGTSNPLTLAGDKVLVNTTTTIHASANLQVSGTALVSSHLSVGSYYSGGLFSAVAANGSGDGNVYIGSLDTANGSAGIINFFTGGGTTTSYIKSAYTSGNAYISFVNNYAVATAGEVMRIFNDKVLIKTTSTLTGSSSTDYLQIAGRAIMSERLTLYYNTPLIVYTNTASSNRTWDTRVSGDDFLIREASSGYSLKVSSAGIVTLNGYTGASSKLAYMNSSGVLTLLSDGSAGYVLSTNGSGTYTWIAAGSGTVTSVSAGTGMSFTTVTSSGAVAIDTAKVPYFGSGFGSAGYATWNGSSWSTSSLVSSQWTTSGSNIYFSTGYVGIGISSPATDLHVRNASESIITNTRTSGNSSTWNQKQYDSVLSADLRWLFYTNGVQALKIDSLGEIVAASLAGTGDRLVMTNSSGQVGSYTIGAGLSIVSGALVSEDYDIPGLSSGYIPYATSGVLDNSILWFNGSNGFGINTTSISAMLHVNGTFFANSGAFTDCEVSGNLEITQTGVPGNFATANSPTQMWEKIGGSGHYYLGEPSVWIKVRNASIDYVVPGYQV